MDKEGSFIFERSIKTDECELSSLNRSSSRRVGDRIRSVRTRLGIAVFLPLGLLSIIAAHQVSAHYSEATDARRLNTEVQELKQLVQLRSALLDERFLLEDSEVSTLEPADLEAVRAATDFVLQGLEPEGRPFRSSDLVRIRQLQDPTIGRPNSSGGNSLEHLFVPVSVLSLTTRYDALASAVDGQIHQMTMTIKQHPVSAGDPEVGQSIDQLDRASKASATWLGMVVSLATYWRAEPFNEAISRSDLARVSQDFERSSVWMDQNSEGLLAQEWAKLSAPRAAMAQSVVAALRGVRNPVVSRPQLDEPAVDFLAASLTKEFVALTPVAAAAVEFEGARLVSGAEQRAVEAMFSWGFAIVVCGLVAFGLARSIQRPIERIAAHAHEVGQGNLPAEPLSLAGPPEFGKAAAAINDMVLNLRLMDRKAQALAAFDLKDPVLSAPLPGQLGKALNESVHILSGSIADRERLQSRLAHEATHDTLTGIPNRAAALSHLELACERAMRFGREIAVVFIDLDDFKRINDTHGHAIGDEVLLKTATRMMEFVRSGDMVARLGGDEFLLVAEGVQGAADATGMIKRLLDVMSIPMIADGLEFRVGACAGITLMDKPEGVKRLMQQADLAVYAAKEAGTGSISIFDEALDRKLSQRIALEEDLRASLGAEGQLRLVYQPILDASSTRLVSLEALLRWDRPGYGPVPPDEFIPIAEQSSLILDIDRWVIGHALGQLSEWKSQPWMREVSMSVNVSGRHVLDTHFVSSVEQAIASSEVDPKLVVLEVTETVLVDDLDLAASQLQKVRDLGVRIAIDDFGTGYTSLAHLRSLPIDKIKIDKSFIQNLEAASSDRSLVRMVSELAGHLGVPTIAEGVETASQRAILDDLGCDTLQGYLFSRPLEPNALALWAQSEALSGTP